MGIGLKMPINRNLVGPDFVFPNQCQSIPIMTSEAFTTA
jgi:hypothetical protein